VLVASAGRCTGHVADGVLAKHTGTEHRQPENTLLSRQLHIELQVAALEVESTNAHSCATTVLLQCTRRPQLAQVVQVL
jgi:hypothetical protein